MQESMQDLWEMFHPAEADEEIDEFRENGDYIDLEEVPLIPTIDRLPDVIDYSTRGPNDFMISGPLGAGRGNGRHFGHLRDAYLWAVGRYGKQRVGVLPQESEFRWAFLIKSAGA